METIQLKLRDLDTQICAAWEAEFAEDTYVDIACEDIFATTADAIISPANSFGFMDGGIDLVYSRRFGWGLQQRLQQLIADDWHGELPIGQAVIIATRDAEVPWLISAPTMRVPENVSDSVNAYLAFRASLIAVEQHNASAKVPITSILCPGLATLTGRMHPKTCARQMKSAWKRENWDDQPSLNEVIQHHKWLKGTEG